MSITTGNNCIISPPVRKRASLDDYSPSQVLSGLPHRTAFHKCYVSEWRETNTVLSPLNCAMNYTYVCQFKEKLST